MSALLEVEGLACGYGGRIVLSDIHLKVAPGEILCLLGPNGVGKTTLFKTILRLLPAKAGRILLQGEDVANWPIARFAARVGYVPQAHTPPFPFSVLDVVSMGRAAHLGAFATPSAADMAIARHSLDVLAISHLAHRPYTEVSGGERQLALIARALTQQPEILVMDEPTSNLDFGNQVTVLDHVRALTQGSNMAVIMTCHDPNQALSTATRVAAIGRAGSLTVGAPSAVITERYLFETYGVRTQIIRVPHAEGGERVLCLPLGGTGVETMLCAAS